MTWTKENIERAMMRDPWLAIHRSIFSLQLSFLGGSPLVSPDINMRANGGNLDLSEYPAQAASFSNIVGALRGNGTVV